MLRRSGRWLPRAGVTVGTAVLLLGLVPVTAEAHQHGCHRWHSCPSDTGSYVCGDLGYFTYCGGTGDSSPAESVDITAPRQPKVVRPHAGKGGRVSLTVTAEEGARIEVAETDESGLEARTVAEATATGAGQTIAFKADSGSHTYTVTATDDAGNTSDVSDDITLDVDADVPAVTGFSIAGPDATTATAHVTFDSEAGAAYELTVSGRKERITGTVSGDGRVSDAPLVLPNGSYTARIQVTDAAGNVGSADRKLRVDLDKLAPQVAAHRAPGSDRVRFAITAPPRSKGTLTVGDAVEQAFTTDTDGRAEVGTQLPDGSYPAPVVEVTDPYRRSGRTSGRELIVDTVAPALKVKSDDERAAHGNLSLAVTTEAHAKVAVLYGAGAHDGFTSSGHSTTVTRALSPGTYRVTVTATDAYGNTTTKQLSLAVDDQRTAGEWLVLLLKMVLVVVLIAAAGYVYRRTRPAREARRARRATERYARELRSWEEERDRLVELAEFAAELADDERSDGDWSASWGKRKRDESVWWATDADMVQPGTNGLDISVKDSGTLVITGQRVLFVGRTRREWLFSKLVHVEHSGQDVTWMRVTNRTNVSGVRYRREPEKTRIAIELAIAEAPAGEAPELGTGRGPVLARLRQAITTHDRQQPSSPEPPLSAQQTGAGEPGRLTSTQHR
ncbi:Ig-like domain-containing protein [Streptomyces sp. HUAS ZL42]|uniref:Ig-like domain repeat protein n=1 Tax=Streptomyces sp. HUAS ZL42 TaxID=3231715 RepID=UPI00345E95A9